MTIQEAKSLLSNIQIDYASIPYPKYLHGNLDDLENQYQKLNAVKDQLKDDFAYVRLLNSVTQTLERMRRTSGYSSWINASERGINKAIPPVLRKANNENILPFHWESEKSGELCSITNGYWSAKNYMVMDFVGYIFLLKSGGDKLPQESLPYSMDLTALRRGSWSSMQMAMEILMNHRKVDTPYLSATSILENLLK